MTGSTGLLFAALAAFSYAVMTILVRKAGRAGGRDDGVLVALVVNVVLHGMVVAVRASGGVEIPWSATGVAWFAVSGILTTLLGRIALYGGIQRVGSSRAAALKNLAPFVSVGAALWILGERISLVAGLGVTLALLCYLILMLEGYRAASVDPVQHVSVAGVGVEDAAPPAPRVGRRRLSSTSLVGYAACTAAAVFYGAGTVVRRVGLDSLPDPYLGAWLSAVTGLAVYVLYLRSRGRLRVAGVAAWLEPQPYYWWAGVASTLGQLSLFVALSLTAVSYVSVIAASDTLLTMLLAAALFGRSEALTTRVVVPAVGIFLATCLIALG